MSPSDSISSSTVDDGVLLYYKYVTIIDVPAIVRWYEDLCLKLKLVGRVRVSPEGVNVTVGGAYQALEEHVRRVSDHPGLGESDFKVARCKEPLLANPVLVQECGFNSLLVRAVKELVSLGNGASHVSHALVGHHLSPADFHQHLLAVTVGDNERGAVVLDARNVYETRIGRFHSLPGIEFHDPQIRQFSDLPAWLDANEDRLRDKHVYMYCTGGVRCERASAYLRVKGNGFQNVYQLSGGIQRYLEAFPDGGLFAGKNFVFDPRVAVGSSDERKIGRCLVCRSPYDDYAPRCRCSRCRLLVLVCDTCRTESGSAGYVCELCRAGERGNFAEGKKAAWMLETDLNGELKSGLGLQKRGRITVYEGMETTQQAVYDGLGTPPQQGRKSGELTEERLESPGLATDQGEEALSAGPSPGRPLRVLCLHGFRQTGRGLRGRLAAFQWNLRDLVELVFVDGPFQLPCLYYPGEATGDGEKQACNGSGGGEGMHRGESEGVTAEEDATAGKRKGDGNASAKFGTAVEGTGIVGRQTASKCANLGENPAVEPGKAEVCEADVTEASRHRVKRPGHKAAGRTQEMGDRGTDAPGGRSLRNEESGEAMSRGPFPKFAWLVSPEQLRQVWPSADCADPALRAPVNGFPGAPLVDSVGEMLRERKEGAACSGDPPADGGRAAKDNGEMRPADSLAESSGHTQSVGPREGETAAEGHVAGRDWRPAPARFGPLQYLTQTAGWDVSLAHLRRVFAEQGPFDGVLGFSQGAAIAAALCGHARERQGATDATPVAFKFVILCSGFASPTERAVTEETGLIEVPSLHVFGNVKGNDRQIHVEESEKLAERFEASGRVVVRHTAGHIVPTSKSYVKQYRGFLAKYL